jgi:hypothetical protein
VVNFDPLFARDVALPLVQAAYAVTATPTRPPVLPAGFTETSLLQADAAFVAHATDAMATHNTAALRAMTAAGSVFGLMGRNAQSKTAFVALRGTLELQEWVADFDAVAEPYRELPGFGDVHKGFQAVYLAVRDSLRAGLAEACAGCTRLLVTGHSLGGALAVLAAPDLLANTPPYLAPQLITFGGPRVGLANFTAPFNAKIEDCVRVVNFLDIVPAIPPAPYTHVGTSITVNSGGSISPASRHSLDSYSTGLAKLGAAAPSAASRDTASRDTASSATASGDTASRGAAPSDTAAPSTAALGTAAGWGD